MNTWSWPQSIAPQTCYQKYVEYDVTAGHVVQNDGGEVEYTFGNGDKFQVQARNTANDLAYFVDTDFQIYVRLCLCLPVLGMLTGPAVLV